MKVEFLSEIKKLQNGPKIKQIPIQTKKRSKSPKIRPKNKTNPKLNFNFFKMNINEVPKIIKIKNMKIRPKNKTSPKNKIKNASTKKKCLISTNSQHEN